MFARLLTQSTHRHTHLLALGIALITLGMLATASTQARSAPVAPAPASDLASTQAQPEANAPDCDPNWSVVSSPNPGTTYNFLYGVAALSSSDVWAVGTCCSSAGVQTLVEHWNGSAWSVIPSPNVGTRANELLGVAAISSSDVWAVGDHSNSTSDSQTLIEHWNGSAWSVIPSPNPGTTYDFLRGVAAISSSNVWAVGYYLNGSVYQTLVEHWNGSAWSVISSPNPSTAGNHLFGVAATSSSDVWAVGDYLNGSVPQTLVEHWNGSAWSVIPSPNVGTGYNILQGVAAISSSDVWAVGYYNGSVEQTLIEHWNGSVWSVIPSPNVGTGYNELLGVAAVSNSDVWAVGDYSAGSAVRTLVERYNPCTTTPTVPVQPTDTSTVTPIPTSTPSICSSQFTDVPISNPFYTFIRCLACRGIISGYPDGTFRPGNDVIRGQIAKMVSNSAGFQEDAGAQIYTDVAPGSTFYAFINRLSRRGFMGGYACGGSGETCDSQNRPYFRPITPASRGQLSKIVANARGLNSSVQGQTYEDVALDSPFYLYIERLSQLGAIGGYPCGGPGEPCDAQHRPYFRPNNLVTRGQASKIVANAFFPNCQTPSSSLPFLHP